MYKYSLCYRWRSLTESVKPYERKKEERRRYRLIPRTFSNWLQAFIILISVIGKKAPDNCLAILCYLNSIGEEIGLMGECMVGV